MIKLLRSKPEQAIPNHWRTEKDGYQHSATLNGIKLEITKHAGSPDTYGGNTVIARHFLEREGWQTFFMETYGQAVYDEMRSAVSHEYEKFRADPSEYNRLLKQNSQR